LDIREIQVQRQQHAIFLPAEYPSILRAAGFEADTVSDEKLSGAIDSVRSERCPHDEMVLETAINGRADALVTYNVADFAGPAERFRISVLRPGDLLKKVKA
jgi:predicted nucleic acid-binding protein